MMAKAGSTVRRVAGVVALGLAVAACSQGYASTAGGSPTSAPMAMSIGTDQIKGLGNVLDTSSGLTLYHNTKESGATIVCTAACAGTWPPVTVSGAVPAAPSGASGTFGTVTRPDGTRQLTFGGMPLYTFAGDGGLGQASGQGLDGVWFAVGPTGPITMSGGSAGAGASGGSSSASGGW